MNPHTPPSGQDQLTSEERELAALYARLPKAEPDAALDAAIVRQAADAVRPAATAARPYAPRWLLGTASAAVLVLAVGIVWRMQALPPEQPVVASPVAKPAPNIHSAAARSRAEAANLSPGHTNDTAPSTAAAAETRSPPPPMPPPAREIVVPKPKYVDQIAQPRKQDKRSSPERALAVPPPPTMIGPVEPPAPLPMKPAAQAPPADIVAADMEHEIAERSSSGNAPRASTVITQTVDFAVQAHGRASRVENIRQLLREGQRSDAVQAAKALHRDQPGFELPQDIAALLGLEVNPSPPESSP